MDTFYLVYKITNNIDGKHYIGVHKTNDINDSYMGSGKILGFAIKKHGIENFTKEIIAVFDTPEDMYQMESVLVNEEFIKRDDTYNIKQGGHGGWDHINSKRTPEEYKEIARRATIKTKGRQHTAEAKLRMSQALKALGYTRDTPKFTGKHHTNETKKLLSDKAKLRVGSKNSAYGKCWITNDKENKMILKQDVEKYVSCGWRKGRV